MHKGNRRKGQGIREQGEVDGYQLTVNSQLSTNSREQGTGNRDKGIGNSQKGKGNRNFFEDVFEVVRLIPPGRVTNYGSIAKYLGSGLSSRMVGWAMNASHIAHPPVPAQRVVNRNGMLTGKHHFATPTLMQELLEKEGIKIEKDKVVDFKNIFWDPAVELEL
jgi:methylated-DNA-protein-cysteine methyltransferase-like protein